MIRERNHPDVQRSTPIASSKENRLAIVEPRHVAIVRPLAGIGDLLCAVPAWRALRAALPDARISVIGLPETRPILHRFRHYVDDLIPFPGFPGMSEGHLRLARFPRQIAALQRRNFDVVLQMHGDGNVSNLFALLVGGSLTAGCYPPGDYNPDQRYFLPYPDDEPEIWRNLRLLQFLGIPPAGDELEFPMEARDWEELAPVADARGLGPEEYVVVNPGGSDPERRWPPEHFAAVADALADTGLQVVLIGTEREAPITQAVADAMTGAAIDLTGQLGIGALAALLWDARLVVCNDTGVSHLADALRVPSVVIFAGYPEVSDPVRWAPLDTRLHRGVCPAAVLGEVSPPPATPRRREGRVVDRVQDIALAAIHTVIAGSERIQIATATDQPSPHVFYV